MMLKVDLAAGAIRLGGHHLDALLRGLGSPFAPDPATLDPAANGVLDQAWGELVDSGAVTSLGQPAEVFERRFAPLVAPWLMVQLDLFGPAGSDAHRLWVGPAEACAAAHVSDGWYDLLPVAPAGVPSALARLGRLGPRDHTDRESQKIPGQVLDDLFAPDGAVALADALPGWPQIAAQIRESNWRILRVETAWAPGLFGSVGEAEAANMALLVLDTIAGYLSLEPVHSEVRLSALSPTDVWQILIGMTAPPAAMAVALSGAKAP
ncbi:MAG: hypothetical protein ACOH1Y_00185 [Propionicimonas sp.]